MKHMEKQQRAWQNIKFVTKDSGRNGVERLEILATYETSSTKSIWEFLQVPYVNTGWVYINDLDKVERRLTE